MVSLENLTYSQPSFYHFSEDSIFLASYLTQWLVTQKFKGNAIDLCSGCGVIGVELFRQYDDLTLFDFVEKQDEFYNHWKVNTEVFLPQSKRDKCTYISTSFQQLDKHYDLVLSNPPYFIKERSREASDKSREQCRAMSEADFKIFYLSLKDVLNSNAHGFILSRVGISEYLPKQLSIIEEIIAPGATIYHLQKLD